MSATLLLAVLAGTASATPTIHAHRGAPTVGGAHLFGEETMAAFQHSWHSYGAVLEMDVKLTRDRVPVVFHDATLDRVTSCSGRVDAKTFAELAQCPVDIVGSPEYELGGGPAAAPQPIPSLQEFLAWARDAGPVVNLEIKNHPQEADFDVSDGYAATVMQTVLASGFPAQRLIVQSFWPPNLDTARRLMPGIQTSILTISQLNRGAPAFAQTNDYTWISPQWPVDQGLVDDAHLRGRGVAPYTLNTPDAIKAAAAMGIDAVITDDVLMARRALGLPDRAVPGSGAGGDRTPPVVRLHVPELASDAATTPRLVLRWEADDANGVGGFDAEVRSKRFDWRILAENSLARAVAFTAEPGERYVVRVRARDGAGNESGFEHAGFSVPKDLRPRRGWKVTRRGRAWMHTIAQPRGRRARVRFAFRGSRLRVLAARRPRGGTLAVRLDGGRPRTASTRGEAAERVVVYDSGPLKAGRHRVRLSARGRVQLDGYATR